MRATRAKLLILASAIMAFLGITIGTGVFATVTATPAYASQSWEICTARANSGGVVPLECLNAWNGGPFGKSYTRDVANDIVQYQFIDGRCSAGSDLTTTNCPAPGVPAGYQIFQYLYNNGQCYGTDTQTGTSEHGGAELTGCNSPSTGFGGGTGTVQIMVPVTVCGDVTGFNAVNSYWTTQDGGGNNFLGTVINAANGDIVYFNGTGQLDDLIQWTYPWGNAILGSGC